MKKQYRYGKDIYPDITDDLVRELNNVLGEYDIEMSWLLDDGVEFSCPTEIECIKEADVVFYKTYSTGREKILIWTEDFGCVRILDRNYNELVKIPTYDKSDI